MILKSISKHFYLLPVRFRGKISNTDILISDREVQIFQHDEDEGLYGGPSFKGF